MLSRYAPDTLRKIWEKNARELEWLENQEVNGKLKFPHRLEYLRARKSMTPSSNG